MGSIIKHGEGYRAVVRKKGYPTKTKVFPRKAMATAWVRDTELAMAMGGVTDGHVTVSSLIDRYVSEIAPIKYPDPMSQRNFRTLSRNVAGLTLAELNGNGLLEWVQTKRKDVSRATIAMDLTMMSSVLRTAEAFWSVRVNWGEFTKARLVLRRMRMVGPAVERTRRPEGDELDRIKSHIQSTLPVADIIDFAVVTAMRSSEIGRVAWSDLDPKKRTITIRDRKHPTDKVGNDQVVPLLGDAYDIILRQPRVEGDDRIFPFNHRSVETAFRRARDQAGVTDLRFHDLRHHGISLLFEQGYGIAEVSLVSGHRSWNQLRRYTNLKPESLHGGPAAKRSA